ncbi:uncharacterized protein LOC142490863 [Ascaphus truei]|uniref:uncharacterized protein LOC142490863 n=1 Tax=Ascaphus truei TaxID=8439 RepID=UPI003F590489
MLYVFQGRTSSASKKEKWNEIILGVNACGNRVRDKNNCRKRFDDIRARLKKKIQQLRLHACGTGGGPPAQRLILTPLEEQLREKLLPVVVEGLSGDRDIGIYSSEFPPVAPGGHVSPETEQVCSPGSCSSSHPEEHNDAKDTEMLLSENEEVPIQTVTQAIPPASNTYAAIAASEEKIVVAENRRHADMMSVLERMISLQEETISQLAHLHRVFIEVPKKLQTVNTTLEAVVVQLTQANHLRMTTTAHQFSFTPSQDGSLHAANFSPHASDIHSPGRDVTGTVAASSVHVPLYFQPLPTCCRKSGADTYKGGTKKKNAQAITINQFLEKN